MLLMAILLLLPSPGLTAPIQNSASGTCNGVPLDNTNAVVNLNSTGSGPAVTDVIAEVNPGAVTTNSNTTLTVALNPTMGATNTGFNQVIVSIPAAFSNISPGAVTVGATAIPAGSCPNPSGNSFCAALSGNDLTITFGNKIASSQSGEIVTISFTADTPASAGSSSFAVSVDDIPTAAPAQNALPGDADGITTNNNSLDITFSDGVDPAASTLTADPVIVLADDIAASNLTATLLDTAGLPISGESVNLATTLGNLVQPGNTDLNGQAFGSISSASPGIATVTASSGGIPFNQGVDVYFTQGQVLDVRKTADRSTASIGDVITYTVEVRNTTTNPVELVSLSDHLPPNFSYRPGSATMDGNPIPDPGGNRTLSFPIGTVPALVDSNANGTADPGEPGYHRFSYQLAVTAGASPGSYTNSAYARDVCVECAVSNRAEAEVEVTLDPLFDLGTIIGKVFEDKDRDGWQDRDEPGVAGAMVALDDGTYVLTDPDGRYHFPAIEPGQRLLKINLLGLGNGATTTTGETALADITPGLLAKVNFGVIYEYQNERIGSPVEYGMRMESSGGARPVDIYGSVDNQMLLLNGQPLRLPSSDIHLRHNELEEVVNIVGNQLKEPILFLAAPRSKQPPEKWQLTILDSSDSPVKKFTGTGPIEPITWDGRLQSGELLSAGSIYQYQLATDYADGTRALSPRRLFGVDRTSAIAMNLTGGAFITGSTELSDAAKKALDEAIRILRRHPHEKIIIEGHTDSTGSSTLNMRLSKQRAEAALAYLTETGALPPDRFVVRWYGETQPFASNSIEEGRELNRRVEINGEYRKVERAQLLDQYHTRPLVAINNADQTPNDDGRFHLKVDDAGSGSLEITMIDAQGATLQTSLEVPNCEILAPRGTRILPFGLNEDHIRTAENEPEAALDGSGTIIETRFIGRTAPGNKVLYAGRKLALDEDGRFSLPLSLREGANTVEVLVRNQAGFTRLAGLDITVATRTEAGGHIIFAEPVPYLAVQMPPTDRPLNSNVFAISGETSIGNRVRINDEEITLQPDGHFSKILNLATGKTPIRIEVTSPEGNYGRIERIAEVSDSRLFFLAFADGKVSQIKASGNIDNAGVDSASEVMTEGRIALYLKGTISGRYLLTAALDTGRSELDEMFSELDETENDRLLTNIDPDRLYPVYGDSSQIVYDTESQGKLYLALESDELELLLGNYRIDLAGGELATYRRTLYGGHAVYRSAKKSSYGADNSSVELFAAEIKQVHIRDEVDATGGSLYYLSRKDVIEGSEQVSISVRDKLTGLRLASLPQEEGIDYDIKYPEGRLLFRRPISSVQPDERLTDSSILAGNPVIIEIDYEARVDSFEKSAAGGRVRQQIGDHIAVGGTYVQDELESSEYRLWGFDTEVRLGAATRLLAEYAESEGAEATVNVSHNGGLTFSPVPRAADDKGGAWKTSLEIDIGEWISRPKRYQVSLYHKEVEKGFHTAGQNREEGTVKDGLLLRLRPTDADTLSARYDIETREVALATEIEELDSATLQWQHRHGRWSLIGEYQKNRSETVGGEEIDDQFATVRLEYENGQGLMAWIEQQQTLSGIDNNQTSLGIDLRLNSWSTLHVSATDGTLGQAVEGGVSLNLGNNRVYLTQRLNETRSQRSQTTVIGGEQTSSTFGKLYSEYQWVRTKESYQHLSIVGAEKGWDIQPGLHLYLGGELSDTGSGLSSNKRTTLVSGFSYTRREAFRFSSRNEIRNETGAIDRRQFLTINRAEGSLSRNLTLLGLYRFSETENRSSGYNEAGFEEVSLGLAWRPVKSDRFNALARLTRLVDEQPVTVGGPSLTTTTLETAAIEWSLQLNRTLEWVEKEAIRWKEEDGENGIFDSRAWLSIHRLNVRLQKQFDLGLEYRMLAEESTSTRKQGWLSEIGWRPQRHFRLGVGYNFTDFSDDERALNDYSVEGWFIRAQGMY